VSPLGGNGQGTRTFWTVPIPDSDVQFDPQTGNVEMRVTDLPDRDYFNLPHALGPVATTTFDSATVSFDIVWSGPVTRAVNIEHGTAGNPFAGEYVEDHVAMTWSASNSAGFSFRSNRGDFSTSVPGTPFAELGFERNGQFALADPGGAAAPPLQPVGQALTAEQLQPAVQQAIASWQVAGASAAQVAALNQVPVPGAAQPGSYPGVEAGRDFLVAGSQGPETTLPLTPRVQTSSTAVLDQAFATAAANPLGQGPFGDPPVLYGG
jgi:hypothetical protein